MAPTRIPTWHRKSDEELRELLRGVWEGEVVGTWQLAGGPERERVFPGYAGFETMACLGASGHTTFFDHPATAHAFAQAPVPAAAYGRYPPHPVHPFHGPRGRELPVFEDWSVLSWEEWRRLESLLDYPPAEPATGPNHPRRDARIHPDPSRSTPPGKR